MVNFLITCCCDVCSSHLSVTSGIWWFLVSHSAALLLPLLTAYKAPSLPNKPCHWLHIYTPSPQSFSPYLLPVNSLFLLLYFAFCYITCSFSLLISFLLPFFVFLSIKDWKERRGIIGVEEVEEGSRLTEGVPSAESSLDGGRRICGKNTLEDIHTHPSLTLSACLCLSSTHIAALMDSFHDYLLSRYVISLLHSTKSCFH